MPRDRRPPPSLDADSLQRLALRYVERYATTRAKLAEYLDRKIRTRGWQGVSCDTIALAGRMVELGYIDDRAFAEAKARAMMRRGLGARRIAGAFRQAGIDPDDAEAIAPMIAESTADAALAFARRKRIGPFAEEAPDRSRREKQIAAMIRGGHDFALARRIASMAPGDDIEEIHQAFL